MPCRRLQPGVYEYPAHFRTRLALEESQQHINLHHIGGALHFRQRDAVQVLARNRFEVEACQPRLQRIDAHEERLCCANLLDHLADDLRAPCILLLRRHRVFEVKDKRIRAVLGRFANPVLLVAGHEQD